MYIRYHEDVPEGRPPFCFVLFWFGDMHTPDRPLQANRCHVTASSCPFCRLITSSTRLLAASLRR